MLYSEPHGINPNIRAGKLFERIGETYKNISDRGYQDFSQMGKKSQNSHVEPYFLFYMQIWTTQPICY